MRGGTFFILVYLASDDSESSQRIGMLDNRLKKKKKKSMGARRRKKSDDDHTASEDPWVPRWLPVLGNRQRHSDVGEEAKEKVQQKGGGGSRMWREVESLEEERKKISWKGKRRTLKMS